MLRVIMEEVGEAREKIESVEMECVEESWSWNLGWWLNREQ